LKREPAPRAARPSDFVDQEFVRGIREGRPVR